MVTVSEYTAGEDFDEARLVLTSLGDPGRPMALLGNRSAADPGLWLTLNDLWSLVDDPAGPTDG